MILSYFSLTIFLFCIFFVFFVLFIDSEKQISRILLLHMLIFSLWPLAEFFYNLTDNETLEIFLYNIKYLGMCGMVSGKIIFYLSYSGFFTRLPKLLRLFVYLYPILMLIIHFSGVKFVTHHTDISMYGKFDHFNMLSFSYLAYILPVLIFFPLEMAAVYYSALKSESERYKKQSIALIIISVITVIVGLFTDLAPQFTNGKIPPVGPFFMIILIFGIIILMKKYYFLRVEENIINKYILNYIGDIVFIVSPDNKVISISNDAENKFGKNCIGKDFLLYIQDKDLYIKEFSNVKKGKRNISFLKMFNIGNDYFSFSMSLSPVFNKFNDFIGVVILCSNLDSRKIFDDYRLSLKEIEITNFIIQGYTNKEIAVKLNVSEGTVKNYIYRIYKKTNSSNRAELIQLFS